MSKLAIMLALIISLAISITPTLADNYASISSLGTFKAGLAIELVQSCYNCTYMNLTFVTAPNSTIRQETG